MRNKSSIPTLSLFSGAGGLDIGFLQAGFDIRACVEIEPSYCATLTENLHSRAGFGPATQILNQDIRSFDARPFRKMGIECVIGGPPCQTFSAAGRRAGGVIGTEDERGQLFTSYIRILQELRPKVFVFENVYGLPGANGGRPWREITSAFSKLGYKLRAEVVDAADYGVPQHRERLIMVGYKTGEFEFPMPTHGPDSGTQTALVSVEDAILDLQPMNEPFHDNLGGMYGHLLPSVPEGLNYSFFTAEMKHPEPVFAWRSKFHDLLYKVSRSEPCRTIKAQPGKFTGPFHWKNRHFTAAELKRLQTFPDEYDLVGSYSNVLEQIGNSVPPRLAYVIAASVREQLLVKKTRLEFCLRPPGFQSTFRQRQRRRTVEFERRATEAIEKQYGASRAPAEQQAERSVESYFFTPANLFDRIMIRERRDAKYVVSVAERKTHIHIKFNALQATQANAFSVDIKGLRKYLPHFETLSVEGRADKPEDMFHVWATIEAALKKRSRFFTLIDIYGHYANRGDTVKITGEWGFTESATLLRAANWLTSSENCGDFVDLNRFARMIKIKETSIPGLIEKLRRVRFDCRSSLTHPIIGEGRLICTYPFPLLSPRALVESRVTFSQREGEFSLGQA